VDDPVRENVMSETFPIDSSEWQRRTGAAIRWLKRSIEVTGDKGSAHSYSPVFGWAKAYPETTGYLIETLLDYAVLTEDPTLRQLAISCADWLCTIQLPDGAFPGLLAGNTRPSVFNTAQILFGLSAAHRISPIYHKQIEQASNWLLHMLEPDGSWQRWSYIPGFTPTYYTRAVWGLLQANGIAQISTANTRMRQALQYYAGRFLPDQAIRDWGFQPDRAAFTHTIAYTLEGFLESAVILNEPGILKQTIGVVDRFVSEVEKKGKAAGQYGAGWKGDYHFICVTGHAQMSVVCWKTYELTQEPRYMHAARMLMENILPTQRFGRNPDTFGSFPGSVPVWGPYMRFRYPNWGVKFFLDAWKYERL
jgi:hypothetical protein